MEAGNAAEHLDRCLEQDDGGRAVDIVVAIEQHRFAIGDRLFKPRDSLGHAQHQERIVKMCDFRIEESEGIGGVLDAASHQQFGQHQRQVSGLSKRGGLVRIRPDKAPALVRELSCIRIGGCSDPVRLRARPTHRDYSSSSS